MDQQAREQAFMSALVTEHFVLQAARSAIVGEQVGRVTIYMGAVSGALIAFGFLAQVVTRVDPFVTAVLPALFVLGELTFAAVAQHRREPGVVAQDAGHPRLLPWPGARGQPVLRSTPGRRAVSGGAGNGWVAGVAAADAVHRSQRGRGHQQHPGRRWSGVAGGSAGSSGRYRGVVVGLAAAVILFGAHVVYQQRRGTQVGL
jgi:hypothetical protein